MATSILTKPLKLGEIAIIEKDWFITFKCEYCQIEMRNFKSFLKHSTKHFFDIQETEIEPLYDTALDEDKIHNSLNSVELTPQLSSANKNLFVDLDQDLARLYTEVKAEANLQANNKFIKSELGSEDDDDDDDVSLDEELFEATDEEDNEFIFSTTDTKDVMSKPNKVQQSAVKSIVSNENAEKVFFHVEKCDKTAKTRTRKRGEKHPKEYFCPYCEKSFANNQNLTYHIRRHTTKYPCDRCDAVFNDINNHRRHYARHLGKKPHACTVCDKRFLTKTELRKHSATHSKERPFSCEECGATFRSMAGYDIHQLKHTNTRPYECEICDKAFYEKRQYEDHVKLHSSDFPYECAECGKQFKTRRPYQAHCRTEHADKKVYECQNCPEVFRERIELFWHLKRNHWTKISKNASLNVNQMT